MPVCINCDIDKPQLEFMKRGDKFRGECKLCGNARRYAWAKANPDRRADAIHRHYAKTVGKDPEECRAIRRTADEAKAIKALSNREWYLRNREKCIGTSRQSAVARIDEVAKYQRQWREANAERKRLNDQQWRQQNAGRVSWYSGNRKKAERLAAPGWLTEQQWAEIQSFYDLARSKSAAEGIKYHVDHIHPIQGKTFSGLHVPWNLQVISAKENRSKSNRLVDAA